MNQRTLWAWVGTLVLLALCLCPRSWMPLHEPSGTQGYGDKVVHFAMFLSFGALWASAERPGRPRITRALTVLAASLVLAVGTELAQGLPGINRDPDTFDALADFAGSVCGVVGLFAVPRADFSQTSADREAG